MGKSIQLGGESSSLAPSIFSLIQGLRFCVTEIGVGWDGGPEYWFPIPNAPPLSILVQRIASDYPAFASMQCKYVILGNSCWSRRSCNGSQSAPQDDTRFDILRETPQRLSGSGHHLVS